MPDAAEIAAFRFGYGLPLAGPAAAGALVAGLRGPDEMAARWPAHGTADILPHLLAIKAARDDGKEAAGDAAATKAANKAQRRAIKATKALALQAAQAAFARAIDSATPLRERLVAFWADHFTVTGRNRTQYAWPSALIEEAIRPHLTAPFATMLQAVVLHPAMLIYLDQVNSLGPNSKRGAKRGKGLNENLARELLELHTLGVGAGYSQADVREMAELLTGLTFVPERGFAFDPARVEPGDDVILGAEYGGEGVAPILRALADLALRPETARHLAGKLAVHFVADDPDPALVAAIEADWLRTGGDLGAVISALLAHPAAWTAEAQKARQPFDFTVAALRALGVTGAQVAALPEADFLALILDPLAAMGQPWQMAPGPDGWAEEAEAWITPQGMAARIDWALDAPDKLVTPLPEARALVARALGSRAEAALVWAVGASESQREAVGLVLASPAFNRR
jgi:uncharacterized protein (DUF1800 family)